MMRFAPKAALGTATLFLALLDWTAGTTIAEPEGPNGGPPSDEMIPGDASLERNFQATAEIDSVAIRVLPARAGYVLEATNPRAEARDVEVEVKVLEVSINPIARMAPIPQEVASEKVTLHCEPGARVRRPLTLAGLAPAAPFVAPTANARSNAGAVLGGLGLAFFRTRTFVVAAASPAASRARPQRQAAGLQGGGVGLGSRPAGQTVLRLALAPTPMPAASNGSANSNR